MSIHCSVQLATWTTALCPARRCHGTHRLTETHRVVCENIAHDPAALPTHQVLRTASLLCVTQAIGCAATRLHLKLAQAAMRAAQTNKHMHSNTRCCLRKQAAVLQHMHATDAALAVKTSNKQPKSTNQLLNQQLSQNKPTAVLQLSQLHHARHYCFPAALPSCCHTPLPPQHQQ